MSKHTKTEKVVSEVLDGQYDDYGKSSQCSYISEDHCACTKETEHSSSDAAFLKNLDTQCDLKMSGEDDALSHVTSKVKTAKETRKKKRRKRSQITICLTNCRYEAIRKIASAFGMKEVSDDEAWNFYWTDMSVSVERAKEMKRFQRINHFPGMLEICRKDLLARNLNRMQKIYPKEYNFFPKTWCLPADFGDALNYSKNRKNKTFIIKPECGSQGRGIYLTKSLKDIKPTDKLICQVYVARPYLVDGYKFDIRVYTLITSCDPLRVFVYNEGLVRHSSKNSSEKRRCPSSSLLIEPRITSGLSVNRNQNYGGEQVSQSWGTKFYRFATSRYADPSTHNTTNVFMHLTNYAVNKHSRTFVHDGEAGSKRKISTLNRLLMSQGVDLDHLWHAIDQVIVKTIISAWPILKHSYHACFPSHDMVNHSPSFHTDTMLDREVKEALLSDTLTMLNIWQCDKRHVLEEDRRRIRDRLLQGTRGSPEYTPVDNKEPEKSPWQTQIQWEETHLGNFRRVYPVGDQYAALFQQPSGSLYLGTASSRARGDCTRLQQEEFQQAKAKMEALKKPSQPAKTKEGKQKHDKDDSAVQPKQVPAERSTSNRTSVKPDKKKDLPESKHKREAQDKEKITKESRDENELAKHAMKKETYVLCSYEPDPILEAEERERNSLLAQRDFLIRSYGMLEQIYLVMKKNGTLRAQDEKKYGVYGRLSVVSNTTGTKTVRAMRRLRTNTVIQDSAAEVGLHVNCCEAMIYCRPIVADNLLSTLRSNKTQVVRMAYQTWKMNPMG